jgi:ArsR family transcriptional regulator
MTALDTSSACFQAFADPTRLRLLHLLGEGEVCVCHLVEALGEPQPKVSRHLAVLRRAGLVTARVEGPWRHYALPARPRGLTRTLLGCVKTCLASVEELQEDLRRLRALRADGACEPA